MNPGGESADTLVKMYLSGVEMMIRLSGSALKNMLALSMALAKEHKKVSGKINLTKMLRQTRDLRTFTMTPAQYKAFKKLAKKQGILFAAVTDKDGKGKLVDVILPATELDRANLLFERILYDPNLGPKSPEPPQPEEKRWWRRIFRKRDKEERSPVPEQEPAPPLLEEGQEREPENPTRPVPATLPEYQEERASDLPMEHPEPIPPPTEVIPLALPAPEGEARIEEPEAPKEEHPKDEEEKKDGETKSGEEREEIVTVLPPEPRTNDGPPRESGGAQPETVQRDAPPSRPALPDTGRSSTPYRSGRKTITDERPSVLKRLEGFREQIAGKDALAPEKGKEAARGGRDAAKPKAQAKGVRVPKKPVR